MDAKERAIEIFGNLPATKSSEFDREVSIFVISKAIEEALKQGREQGIRDAVSAIRAQRDNSPRGDFSLGLGDAISLSLALLDKDGK